MDDSLKNDILRHADILAVVSSYGIQCQKKGKSYVALCPFHDDHNPSMNVNLERGTFMCWSCHTGGDAITFVRKMENLGYLEALRKVAEIAGIQDPRLSSLIPERKEDPEITSLRKTIEDLLAYYRYAITTPEGERAGAYLLSRGIGEEAQSRFQIGYAPLDGAKTVEFLLKKGHSLHDIEGIGIIGDPSRPYDMNAGRVAFPLFDPEGRPVGFSCRVLGDGKPKYVNSPETRLFHKNELLYGFHLAKEKARHAGRVYVLEGFLDVIALHQAGVDEAVALMGTALTERQIRLLSSLKCEACMCLDGDEAGRNGMMHAVLPLGKAGIPARFVHVEGETRDPDEIFRQEGKEKLLETLSHLLSPFEFQLEILRSRGTLRGKEGREKAVRYFAPYLLSLPAGIEREDALVRLAQATGYEVLALREALRDGSLRPREKAPPPEEGIPVSKEREWELRDVPEEKKRFARLERELLTYMLRSERAIALYESRLGSFEREDYREIASFLLDMRYERKAIPGEQELHSRIEEETLRKEGGGEGKASRLGAILLSLYEEDCYPPESEQELLSLVEGLRAERREELERKRLDGLSLKPQEEATRLLQGYAESRKRMFERKKGRKG